MRDSGKTLNIGAAQTSAKDEMRSGRRSREISEVCPLNDAQLGVYLEYAEMPDSIKYNVDDTYLDRAILCIMTLDYFDLDALEED